jgi:hypothetical protein
MDTSIGETTGRAFEARPALVSACLVVRDEVVFPKTILRQGYNDLQQRAPKRVEGAETWAGRTELRQDARVSESQNMKKPPRLTREK